MKPNTHASPAKSRSELCARGDTNSKPAQGLPKAYVALRPGSFLHQLKHFVTLRRANFCTYPSLLLHFVGPLFAPSLDFCYTSSGPCLLRARPYVTLGRALLCVHMLANLACHTMATHQTDRPPFFGEVSRRFQN
jgi:hypothetical protein